MYEIISVRDDSVRIRTGGLVLNVKVVVTDGKKRIITPRDIWFDNHAALIGKVLEAYEKVHTGERVTHEDSEIESIAAL